MNGPWNQINLLLSGFNDANFPLICVPVLQVSAVLFVVACLFYYIQSRRLRNYSVYLDLNEWLLWTSMGTFLLLMMYVVFGFDFIFVLPTMLIGAGSVHLDPLHPLPAASPRIRGASRSPALLRADQGACRSSGPCEGRRQAQAPPQVAVS